MMRTEPVLPKEDLGHLLGWGLPSFCHEGRNRYLYGASSTRNGANVPSHSPDPLPPAETELLRKTGKVAGALLGAGGALLLPGIPLFGFSFLIASNGGIWGSSQQSFEEIFELWTLIPVVLGASLVAGGWWLSVGRLKVHGVRWANKVTLWAGALTVLGSLLADLLMLGLFILAEGVGIAPAERILLVLGGLFGVFIGGFIGRGMWVKAGVRLQGLKVDGS